VAAAAAVVTLSMEYRRFTETPLIPDGGTTQRIEVAHGSTFRHVAAELAGRGLISRAAFFQFMARWQGEAEHIKAGEYSIDPGMTPQALLNRMVRGDVVQYSLTIVEGWTFAELMTAVNGQEALRHTLKGKSDAEIMAAIGYPNQHPEGRFFPDTYHFPRGFSDADLLRKAHKLMDERLEAVWQSREKGLPLDSAYQALILASIIEKETAVPDERERIAGVFVRRLRRGMRLQTDPTVIYGLGDSFDGNLRRSDLRRDNPYNTYTRAGLPPTPIAMPGEGSLQASVHPAHGDALYFVAKGDGSHHFSASLEEHNRAVRKFQLGH